MDTANLAENYYTAAQAMAKLGLTKTMFYQRVGAGQIPKVTPPGRRQSYYPKRDVDALALVISMAFQIPQKLVFSRSTPGDQVEEMEIGARCFGAEYITPLPDRIAFQQKSEYTYWSLKDNGRVVGYLSIIRLPEDFLEKMLLGDVNEGGITIKEVLPFPKREPFDVYVDVMATDPRLSHHLRRLYAGVIISRFANAILDLRQQGYIIRTIYAVSTTPEGDNIIKRCGFKLIEGKNLAPGRISYELPLDEAVIEHMKNMAQISRT